MYDRVPTASENHGKIREGFTVLEKSWNVILSKILEKYLESWKNSQVFQDKKKLFWGLFHSFSGAGPKYLEALRLE